MGCDATILQQNRRLRATLVACFQLLSFNSDAIISVVKQMKLRSNERSCWDLFSQVYRVHLAQLHVAFPNESSSYDSFVLAWKTIQFFLAPRQKRSQVKTFCRYSDIHIASSCGDLCSMRARSDQHFIYAPATRSLYGWCLIHVNAIRLQYQSWSHFLFNYPKSNIDRLILASVKWDDFTGKCLQTKLSREAKPGNISSVPHTRTVPSHYTEQGQHTTAESSCTGTEAVSSKTSLQLNEPDNKGIVKRQGMFNDLFPLFLLHSWCAKAQIPASCDVNPKWQLTYRKRYKLPCQRWQTTVSAKPPWDRLSINEEFSVKGQCPSPCRYSAWLRKNNGKQPSLHTRAHNKSSAVTIAIPYDTHVTIPHWVMAPYQGSNHNASSKSLHISFHLLATNPSGKISVYKQELVVFSSKFVFQIFCFLSEEASLQ